MRSSAPPYLSTSSGPGSLTATPLDAAFSSLFYLFALSACACRFEVTVTSVSLPPFMSRRGLVIYIPVRVALKLRSLRFRTPRLCRIAVFLMALPPPGGLARLRALSLPFLVCWGDGVLCVAYRAQ